MSSPINNDEGTSAKAQGNAKKDEEDDDEMQEAIASEQLSVFAAAAAQRSAEDEACKRNAEGGSSQSSSSDGAPTASVKKPPPAASATSKKPEERLSLFEQDKRNRKRRLNRITAQRKRIRQRAELEHLKESQNQLTTLNKGIHTENNALRNTISLLRKQQELRQQPDGEQQAHSMNPQILESERVLMQAMSDRTGEPPPPIFASANQASNIGQQGGALVQQSFQLPNSQVGAVPGMSPPPTLSAIVPSTNPAQAAAGNSTNPAQAAEAANFPAMLMAAIMQGGAATMLPQLQGQHQAQAHQQTVGQQPSVPGNSSIQQNASFPLQSFEPQSNAQKVGQSTPPCLSQTQGQSHGGQVEASQPQPASDFAYGVPYVPQQQPNQANPFHATQAGQQQLQNAQPLQQQNPMTILAGMLQPMAQPMNAPQMQQPSATTTVGQPQLAQMVGSLLALVQNQARQQSQSQTQHHAQPPLNLQPALAAQATTSQYGSFQQQPIQQHPALATAPAILGSQHDTNQAAGQGMPLFAALQILAPMIMAQANMNPAAFATAIAAMMGQQQQNPDQSQHQQPRQHQHQVHPQAQQQHRHSPLITQQTSLHLQPPPQQTQEHKPPQQQPQPQLLPQPQQHGQMQMQPNTMAAMLAAFLAGGAQQNGPASGTGQQPPTPPQPHPQQSSASVPSLPPNLANAILQGIAQLGNQGGSNPNATRPPSDNSQQPP